MEQSGDAEVRLDGGGLDRRVRSCGLRMGGMHVDIDEEDSGRLEGKVKVAKTGARLMRGMTLDLGLRMFTLFNVTARMTTRYDDSCRLP